jgi:cell wall-associated NlpC family hydrolase
MPRPYPARSRARSKLALGVCSFVLFASATAVGAQELRTEPRYETAAGVASAAPATVGIDVAASAQSLAQSFADRAVLSAQELAMYAMGLIGIRYTFGGRTPDTGFDCSGLVRYVFNRVTGRALPHNAFEMARMGVSVAKSELQVGDLVFYNTRGARFSHVGIYIGEGRFVHAPSRGGRVHIVDMSNRYWINRFDGARRLAG